MATKIEEALNQYPTFELEDVKHSIIHLLDRKVEDNRNIIVYRTIFNCIDLTSLNSTDNQENIGKIVQKVNTFADEYSEINNVAGICVYPSLVKTVKDTLTDEVEIVSVCGGFPHSQTFPEVKIAETSLAVLDGATEIDIVFPIAKLKDHEYEEIISEIKEIKSACKNSKLKVILEAGALNIEELRIAAILSMEAGADFIKTSTGKQEPAATPLATWIMCSLIKKYHEISNRKVGFKAAGGIKTTDQALQYYCIVEKILGEEWLNKELLRFGASSLANNVLNEILGKKINFF